MLVRQSANIPFTSNMYSAPTWFVGLPATEQCCFVNYNSYTGENHSVHPTFIDLTCVHISDHIRKWTAILLIGRFLVTDC